MSHVRVGVAGIIRRGRSILMGKRRGSHAPDPLFLPTKNLLRDGSDPWRATTMIPAPIPQARR